MKKILTIVTCADVDALDMETVSLDAQYPDGDLILEIPDESFFGSNPLLILILSENQNENQKN